MTAETLERGDRASRTRSSTGSPRACTRSTPTSSGIWLDTRPGRQPLRQPRHHRRDRAAPALRRLEEVRRRRRHQGRRPELPDRPRRLGQRAQHRPGRRLAARRRPLDRAARPRASWTPTTRVAAARPGVRRRAWAEEFGTAKDVSGLSAERNIFRYRALPVTVRLSEGEPARPPGPDRRRRCPGGLRADGVHRRRTPRPAAHRPLRPWHRRHRGERRRLAGLRGQARRHGQARRRRGSG